MRPNLTKTLVAGFVATVVLTLFMYYVARMMMGQPMDVAQMLAGLIGVTWMIGMVLHFVNGTVIFPLIYSAIYRFLPGSPWLRGTVWGFILFLLAELVFVPMVGGGLFHTAHPKFPMPLMGSLVGHLIYGAILGALAGSAAASSHSTATSRSAVTT